MWHSKIRIDEINESVSFIYMHLFISIFFFFAYGCMVNKQWKLMCLIWCHKAGDNQTPIQELTQKEEIQFGDSNWRPKRFVCNSFCWKNDRILYQAVFQIYCSPLTDPVQPSDSGKRNTAKSCIECRKNIQNVQYRLSIITMRLFIHSH